MRGELNCHWKIVSDTKSEPMLYAADECTRQSLAMDCRWMLGHLGARDVRCEVLRSRWWLSAWSVQPCRFVYLMAAQHSTPCCC